MSREIELSESDALTLYRALNEVCVSLDQIGSRASGGGDSEGKTIYGYFGEDEAFRRLSDARGIMIEAVERAFSESEIDEINDQIIYWADRHPEQ